MKDFKKKIGYLAGKTQMVASAVAAGACAVANPITAYALGTEQVTIQGQNLNADQMMGRIIGILLSITRYVGVAMVVYGVYEVVMSFTQDMPEKKTKGITMALAGVVMVALKSLLQGLGVVA